MLTLSMEHPPVLLNLVIVDVFIFYKQFTNIVHKLQLLTTYALNFVLPQLFLLLWNNVKLLSLDKESACVSSFNVVP